MTMSHTLLTLALVVASSFGFLPASYPTQPPSLQAATVTNVVNGDTLDVQLAGKTERLRLIGSDTEQAAKPVQPQQGERCFPETNQCISGVIRAYWEGNGGLA